jgi:hypothetical protein
MRSLAPVAVAALMSAMPAAAQMVDPRVEREVLAAIARDIAGYRGMLLGIGPNPDRDGTTLPHRISLDTTRWCTLGRGGCALQGARETLDMYRAVSQAMGVPLSTDATDRAALNVSTYWFSEVHLRGDSALVRVYMGWSDWVVPRSGHVVSSLFVALRGPDQTWSVSWKGQCCVPPRVK